MDASSTPDVSSNPNSVPTSPSKIIDTSAIAELKRDQPDRFKVIVLCHGCFDLLHLGHLRHLKNARRMGSVLIVSVTADAHVRKGEGRPLFTLNERIEMLAELQCIDYVVASHEATAVANIQKIQPQLYVKGSDYNSSSRDARLIAELQAVEKCQGRVVWTDDPIQESSTALIANSGLAEKMGRH